jgi:spore coat protein U domain-containing protein, fimbrial subunit CupE1/2/3/6
MRRSAGSDRRRAARAPTARARVRGYLGTAALGGALALAAPAGAAIIVQCTATANSINFGIYNPLATAGDASTGTLAVACTGHGTGAATITVGVTLSPGLSGSYAARTMLSGANVLNYNIYWDPQHTVVMGNGTGGSYGGTAGPITVQNGGSIQATGTMYGFVPPNQDPAPGSYSDVITVTVTY